MKMRNRTILIGALLLVLPGVTQAQQAQQSPASAPATQKTTAPTDTGTTFAPTSRIDFGFRANDVSGDPARFQRFRDERDGGYIPVFQFQRENETTFFRAEANNVGYRDQRYAAQYQAIGKVKLNFEWNQIPLFISSDIKTLYRDNGNGVLTIDQGLRQAIQDAGTGTSAPAFAALRNGINTLGQSDMRSRRDIGRFNVAYSLNRDVDLKLNVKTTHRTGYNLMSFGFGTSPGLNPAVELGVPTDDRTTDIGGMLEFANTRGLFSVGFTGSSYDNHIPTVRFDNPLRATDAASGPASGLTPMWPSNNAFAFNVNGSYKLPVRSRASAYLSIGRWNQNEALVAPTVNTALVAPPLERPNAETKADIVSMVYNFNTRPNETVWLNAKYRYYDYANKTPRFEMPALVGDFSFNPATAAIWENEPASFKRGTLDLDASFTPYKYLGFGLGMTREDSDRTFRIFEKTAENSFRVTADSTGNQYVTARAKYEHSRRTGSGFDEALLDEVGEQPLTRHFDIADRDRDRATLIVTVTPVAQFDINASASTGKDDYRNTGFGLRDNNNNAWSLGFDVLPNEKVNLGFNYGAEKYTALQYSRTANPLSATDQGFNDPTRDWWDDQTDKVKTVSANLDVLKVIAKTDIRLSYDLSDGKATYVYTLKPEQKVFTTIPLTQLPTLKNKLTDTRIDLTHYVRQNIALGIGYWYESYRVDDFALNASTSGAIVPANGTTGVFASTIYSGYLYRNYTAHTGFLRMSYLW
jgi:MtrB/PioB family decaheme-associated outer membrane protein